jgi:hypothetical protein
MIRTARAIAATMIAGMVATVALAAPPAAGPTVVELYQSQGCSSCPPADLVLNRIADRPDVLALNFAVTYWDRLGWKDSFAKPAFTQRQWDYAHASGRAQVATPQMIVDGRGVLTGNTLASAQAAIVRFGRRANIALTVTGDRIAVGPGAAPGSTLWLVAYDPRTIEVAVGAGENAGRTIPHRNIVRALTALGQVPAAGGGFRLPPRSPHYREALLVQGGVGGPILAARTL